MALKGNMYVFAGKSFQLSIALNTFKQLLIIINNALMFQGIYEVKKNVLPIL